MNPKELMENAVQILDKKKGMQIVALKIDALTTVADYFVLVTGTSTTHIRALADELEDGLSKLGEQPDHIEGKATAGFYLTIKAWSCMCSPRTHARRLIWKNFGAMPKRSIYPALSPNNL